MLGLKGTLIAGAVVGVIAFGAGWQTRDAFCDAAKHKRDLEIERGKVADLRLQIETRDRIITEQQRAIDADTERSLQVAKVLEELERQNAELVASIQDGDCLTSDESDALRRRLEGAR